MSTVSPKLRLLAATGALGAVVAVAAVSAPGEAQPPAPDAFCEVYTDAPLCEGAEADCTVCHTTPPSLNAYGVDLAAALSPGEARPLHEDVFLEGLEPGLRAIEDLDSDDDGYLNLEEIMGGSSPSDAGSTPIALSCKDTDKSDGYDVCGYDYDYAFKKVMLDFCGRSPSMLEREDFRRSSNKGGALHDQLDVCLDSEFWRGFDGRVWNIANRKIGPQQAVKSGRDGGEIPLADYDDDFAYFVWTQTDDRDVRLVLTGQTFVSMQRTNEGTVYEEWNRSPREDADLRGYDRYQGVIEERRAGLITHRWFLMSNTMFTSIPRTTAAQAYRAFLGYDISKLEGLHPIADEPQDYDNKGVQVEACASCHSTLDPLSYPFSRYEGIGGGNAQQYSYSPRRLEGFKDVDGIRVTTTPEAGYIFGEPVADLVEWAEVAANSRAFRRSTVLDYWRLLLREDPRATERGEFNDLVDALGTDHGWSVEAMLHDLIDTEAYGAP